MFDVDCLHDHAPAVVWLLTFAVTTAGEDRAEDVGCDAKPDSLVPANRGKCPTMAQDRKRVRGWVALGVIRPVRRNRLAAVARHFDLRPRNDAWCHVQVVRKALAGRGSPGNRVQAHTTVQTTPRGNHRSTSGCGKPDAPCVRSLLGVIGHGATVAVIANTDGCVSELLGLSNRDVHRELDRDVAHALFAVHDCRCPALNNDLGDGLGIEVTGGEACNVARCPPHPMGVDASAVRVG